MLHKITKRPFKHDSQWKNFEHCIRGLHNPRSNSRGKEGSYRGETSPRHRFFVALNRASSLLTQCWAVQSAALSSALVDRTGALCWGSRTTYGRRSAFCYTPAPWCVSVILVRVPICLVHNAQWSEIKIRSKYLLFLSKQKGLSDSCSGCTN